MSQETQESAYMPAHLAKGLCELVGYTEEEICGLVIVNGTHWQFLAITNVAPDPRTTFSMAKQELLLAHATYGDAIVGCYHSHPGGHSTPSFEDTALAPRNMRYWIFTKFGMCEYNMATKPPHLVHEYRA